MTDPCHTCGARHLAAVHSPDHTAIEAIVCLTCGTVQPASQPTRARTDTP